MTHPRALSLALALLALIALPAFGQTAAGVPGSSAPPNSYPGAGANNPGSNAPGRRGQRQQPCWQVAGISQATFQQHHQIEENTHSQVQSVCSNTSLNPQQKQAQIRQIREQAEKEMQNLVSPQQQESLRACREQRGEQRGGGGGTRRGGSEGGCGEMPAGNGARNGSKPQPQSEPPSEQQ
jgi:hypothetical protein